jgi:uncharacterized protein (UPF0128 family)
LREELGMTVFEKRVMRKIFGPKWDEVTRTNRSLNKGRLYDLQYSPNIIREIKSRRRRWARIVACRGRGEIYTGYWLAKLRERDNLEDTEEEGRIIIKWIFKKCYGGMN